MNASIKSAVFAIFSDADNSSASFADRLLSLGVGDRATARPLAMEWAAKKYGADLKESNKGGMTFVERNTAAEQAMYRVLAVCFPSADIKPVKAKGRAQQDAVEKLLAAYAKLDAAQKRSFKAKLAKA